jgi:hypothetical protein
MPTSIDVFVFDIVAFRHTLFIYFQMATSIDVFVFDIVALGHNCWDEGLKSIFQSPSVSKVSCTCQTPSFHIVYPSY